MSVLLLAMPGEEARAERLAPRLAAEVGPVAVKTSRGQHKVTLPENVGGRPIAILASLYATSGKSGKVVDPDTSPVWATAQRAREEGATRVGLVAPYLPVGLDEDRSAAVIRRVCDHLDWLVTVDPHPQGFKQLTSAFDGQTRVVTAAPAVAGWIRKNVANPVLVGTDLSSEPWVGAAARKVGAPFILLGREKVGDREVVVVPDADRWWSYQPVLVTEYVNSGRTLATFVSKLVEEGLPKPNVVAVHGLFVAKALDTLGAAGAAKVVTCDTIHHVTNGVRLDAELAQSITALAGR